MENENPGNSVNPKETGIPSAEGWLGVLKTFNAQQIKTENFRFMSQLREEKLKSLEALESLHKRQLDILNTMSKRNHIITRNHDGNQDPNSDTNVI